MKTIKQVMSIWAFLTLSLTVNAQNLTLTASEQTISYNGTYQDFIIPNNLDLSQFNVLSFTMRGGDGGRRRIEGICSVPGGRGATVEAKFAITPSGQTLRKGGTIRFIVGQKGNNVLGSNVEAAGGGGGTAILYRPPGVSGNGTCTSGGLSSPTDGFDENCWMILAVAGGGGGAYSAGGCAGESSGKGGNDSTNGSDGKGSDSGNGGQDGRAGFVSDFLILSSAGGGWDPSKPGGTDNSPGEQGRFEGGAGVSGQNNLYNKGGFGYGGGGGGGETSVNAVGGGGGGGFSGGGAGGSYKGGGGGGSFLNATALDDSNITPGGTSPTPDNGVITYRFQYRQDLLPTVACVPFPIIAQVSTSQNYTLSVSDVESSSSFGCGSNLNKSLSQINFTCDDLGPNTVTLTVSDNCGHTASCNYSFNITELSEPLNLSCPGDINTSINPSNCIATLSNELQPVFGGACGSNLTYDLKKGTNTLNSGSGVLSTYDFVPGNYTLSYQNSNSNNTNTLNCSFNINVTDGGVVGPTALCKNVSVLLDDNCTATVPITSINDGSFDNCFDIDLAVTYQDCSGFLCVEVFSNTGVNISEAGTLDVTLNVTNSQSVTNTCTATIIATDDTAPNAVCKNATVSLNDQGTTNISLNQIHGTSTDNCSGVSPISASQTIFDCSDVNTTHTVTLTVQDGAGNQSTCNAQVTVVDNTSPQAVCKNITKNLDAQGMVTITLDEIHGASTDNCGGVVLPVSASQTTFDCNDVTFLNPNMVTLTVQDDKGNQSTCVAEVTILDNIAPTIVCEDKEYVLEWQNGVIQNATLPSELVLTSATDNCGVSLLAGGGAIVQLDCSDVGNTIQQTVTKTDVNGNNSSCSANVTIKENTPPIAICQNQTVYLSDPFIDGRELAGNSTDNCTAFEDLSFIIFFGGSISGPSTGFGCESVGVNDNYSVDVWDESGNFSSCNVSITVIDDIAPTAVCQNTSVELDAQTGTGTISLTQIHGASTDNCGGIVTPVSANQLSFDCANLGENTVTLTVEDEYGNQSTCTANVQVEDNTPPVLSCEDKVYELQWFDGVLQNNAIPFDYVLTNVSDNCDLFDFVFDTPLFVDCSDIGITIQQTITRVDLSNNITQCTANITIIENTPPQAQCKNVTVTLDGNGMGVLNASQVNNGSSDECGIANMNINGNTTFDCNDIGTLMVTLTVDDPSGNMASCQSTVIIEEGTNLPADWTSTDIGQVTVGNDYLYEACSALPVFSIIGSGNNTIGGNHDNIAFAHQNFCGDGTITAKLESVDPNGYGGLMIRETTDVGSKQVAVFSNLSAIYRHETRYATNATKQVNSFFKTQSSWLRLERQGDWVFAYYSLDGNNFQYIHGVYVPMQSCVEIGLASFTYLPNSQTEAMFSNVLVSGGNSGFGDGGLSQKIRPSKPCSSSPNLTLFPNPNNGQFILQLEQANTEEMTAEVYNLTGQRVAQKQIQPHTYEVQWQINNVPSGTYLMRLFSDNGTVMSKPFVILR